MKTLKVTFGIGVGIAFLVLLFVFRTEVGGALGRFRAALGAASDPAFSYEAFKNLERENEELKATRGSSTLAGANLHDYHYRTARVYSRYPMGSGGRLTVDAGSEDGVETGMPVLLSEGVLLGHVVAVRRTQSEVETVLSTEWKSSVIAGDLKVLLQGGTAPRLELVPKDTALPKGERVLNASPEFPLGFLVGTVGDASKESQADLWSSYELVPPTEEENIETVLVILDFP